MTLELLSWDTDFFGWKTGRFLLKPKDIGALEHILDNARREDFKLIYVFAEHGTVVSETLLNSYEGWLADNKIVYAKNMTECVANDQHVSVYKLSEPGDDLERLAFLSGRYSRFLTDKHIPDDYFYRMYRLWIRRSVNHEIADDVYIYEKDQAIAGMATLKTDGEVADIGLIAVDEQFQGQGCGRKLIDACGAGAYSRGAKELRVATQLHNRQACRFYERCGFSVSQITDIYHFWL